MQRVAQDWQVLERTHSGMALGIVTGPQFLPTVLISPYAGLVVSGAGWSRRCPPVWFEARRYCSV